MTDNAKFELAKKKELNFVYTWNCFMDFCIELKPENIGIYKDEYVLIDYGYNRWLFYE